MPRETKESKSIDMNRSNRKGILNTSSKLSGISASAMPKTKQSKISYSPRQSPLFSPYLTSQKKY